ncbi:hypothetical protein, partial [Escherichia coli]|uniref:hypothetical protein n=1 Tax=Escherichia coli TaxID=562 RepID=UPI0037BE6ED8
ATVPQQPSPTQHLVRRQLIAATISSVSILDCAIQNRRKNNDGFLYMIGFAGHLPDPAAFHVK